MASTITNAMNAS